MTGHAAWAPPEFSIEDDRLWHYRAYVIRVVDGDTVILYLDRGLQDYVILKVRLAGVDAPELRPREGSTSNRSIERALGERARARLAELIEFKQVIVRTQKTAKHGRWLATIFLPTDPRRSANQLLIDEGLAVPYGSRRPWRGE